MPYLPEHRKFVKDITVAQLCEYLVKNVPSDAVVHICGDNWFYTHLEADGSVFNLDNDSLSDLPGYEDDDVEEL